MTDTRLPDGAAEPVHLASGSANAGLPRRLVLGGAAALGGAVVLAACGGSSATDDAAGGDTSGGSSTGDAGSGGGSLVAAADVPVGGGVIVAAQKVVVTQPTEGEFKGFSSTCTHQGCQVSSVEEDQIVCACHGSVFSGTDGAVLNGPATAPLPEVAVSVSGDQVVLA
jgi:Rieske Fe-S protein